MEHPGIPIHSSIVAVDVERFSDAHRNDAVQLRIRAALYRMLGGAFGAANVSFEKCVREDRGDGAIIIVPAVIPKVLLLHPLLQWLAFALDEHNREAGLAEHFRLRFALHDGAVLRDEHGYAGDAVILACRLLDSAELKEALRNTSGNLAVIVSDRVYQDTVRPGYRDLDPATYHPVEVTVKSTRAKAWIHLPGSPQPPVISRPAEPSAPAEDSAKVHIEGTATGPRSTGVRIGRLDIG